MTRDRHLRVWIALWTVYLVWGSTYLGIKLAVRTLPPLLTAGTRFLAGAALMTLVLLALRRPIRVAWREAAAAMGLGALMLGVGVGLVHVAETRIDSGVAAMIAGSVPLQVVLWRTLARDRVPRATIAAAGTGLAGLALVVGVGGIDAGWWTATGLLVMLVGTACWSRGSFIAERLPLPADTFTTAFWQMVGGGLLLLIAGSAIGEWGDVTREVFEPGPVAAWAYLAVMGSVVGYTAYAWLLRAAPISQVVTHQYVNPLVAVALGALFLGERPEATTLIGAVLIVGSVVATTLREGVRKTEPTTGGAPAAGR